MPLLFSHARTALWYGLQQLPMEKGQTILVPDYICEVVLHPLEDLGIRAIFYPVNDSFVPDWEVVETLRSNKPVHAFLLVHYFGQPQDIERAKEYCNQHGLWLIEDNSHGHGGKYNGRLLGSYGDLGISSPYKQLETASGGILYLGEERVESPPDGLSDYPISRVNQFLRRRLGPITCIKAMYRQFLRSEPDFADPKAFPETRTAHHRADPYSTRRILDEDWVAHSAARREDWKVWSRFAVVNGLQPIWQEPHPESSPWMLPVYTSNSNDRLNWLRNEWRSGNNFSPWPTLPDIVLGSSTDAISRWHRLLCIPLHGTIVEKK